MASDPHPSTRPWVNVGGRLTEMARERPDQVAVVMPLKRDSAGKRRYAQLTFRELDEDSRRIAAGLRRLGAHEGLRLVLLVRPSIDFISLVFALFRAGVVTVLIDPGLGRRNMIRCLEEVEPDGFVAIPPAQAVRVLLSRKFPKARLNVTVGRRWFWGGATLDQLRAQPAGDFQLAPTRAEDPAAIIFTTGSTGPSKGVLYRHGNFDRQVDEIRDAYGIRPGGIDLPGFPLFALFNAAMGVTTVIPDMDFTRPAQADPRNILEAAHDWQVTQAFGSPALWNTVGRYCETHGERIPTLRCVLSAGAPVPPHVLRRMKAAIHPEGDVHTPYGATEALPVATIAASQILSETAARTAAGAGTCVGRRFPGIRWKVIRIQDGPLTSMDQVEELPQGEIGELIVSGRVVTTEYVTRVEANPLHKIQDGANFWHRMGDLGYLDSDDRFWFCGRKAHRVQTADGTLFTIPCEGVFNRHPWVYRSALVGVPSVGVPSVGATPAGGTLGQVTPVGVGGPGWQTPVLVVEPWPEYRAAAESQSSRLFDELRALGAEHAHTRSIRTFLVHPSLPVDIRHNAKIFRERLAEWAAKRLIGREVAQ